VNVQTWEDEFLHAGVTGAEETVQTEVLCIADEQTPNQQQNSLCLHATKQIPAPYLHADNHLLLSVNERQQKIRDKELELKYH